jgi:hypothetical protein
LYKTPVNEMRFISLKQQHLLLLFVTISSLPLSGCANLGANLMGEPTKPPVTVPQIVLMSKEGVPADEIIEQMRESGTVYRLQASQLAQLKEQGVPDAVIDYMQQTYIDAVRRDQSLEDWDNWTLADDGFWYGGPWWW